MAHELTIRADGRAEMAFAGDTPWHRLGQKVTLGASIGVWAKEAGMDWTAFSGVPCIERAQATRMDDHMIRFDNHKAIWRSDTKEPLAIVGAGYNIVQPREVLEFFRDMTEEGGWHIHTAGTLRGGRKLWAMASKGGAATLGKKGRKPGQTDTVLHNLLLATSLDGSMKTTVADTTVCVVCANTLAAALRDNDRVIEISHRSVFDADAVKRALGLAEGSFEAFMRTAKELADEPVSLVEAQDLLADIFGQKKAPDTSWLGSLRDAGKQQEAAEDQRSVLDALVLFKGAGMGSELPTRQGTRWGLLNAVTEMVDHHMGRSRDTALDSAWFGRGNALKQRALKVLTA